MYRSDDDDARKEAEAALQARAAQGHKLRSAQSQQELRKADAEALAAREEKERAFADAVSLVGAATRGMSLVAGGIGMLWPALTVLSMVPWALAGTMTPFAVAIVSPVLWIPLALLLGALLRPRDVARARAWIAAYPYPLQGLAEALERPGRAEGVRIELAFLGPPPSLELLSDLAAAARAGAPVKVTQEAKAVLLECNSVSLFGSTNRWVWTFFVALHERALVPLHRVHPLASVRVVG